MRWVHVFHVVDPLIPGISYIQSEEGHCELFVIAAADFSVVVFLTVTTDPNKVGQYGRLRRSIVPTRYGNLRYPTAQPTIRRHYCRYMAVTESFIT